MRPKLLTLAGAEANNWLNVAATSIVVDVLGPGRRGVVWVQGCPFRCAGCISPEWVADRPARRAAPGQLVRELLADSAVVGLTFSGGEPMAQAAGLAEVARLARQIREVSVVCFTGYAHSRLVDSPPSAGVDLLLAEVDVLIDGVYVAARNDGRGLRGSENQEIHYLTDRLVGAGYDFAGQSRKVQIRLGGSEMFLLGVPPPGVLDVLDAVAGYSSPRGECQ